MHTLKCRTQLKDVFTRLDASFKSAWACKKYDLRKFGAPLRMLCLIALVVGSLLAELLHRFSKDRIVLSGVFIPTLVDANIRLDTDAFPVRAVGQAERFLGQP